MASSLTATTSTSTNALQDADAGRGTGCPFGFGGGGAPTAIAQETISPVDERLAAAAQKMAEQGMQPSQIASLLGMDEETVKAAVARLVGTVGKVLGNQKQKEMDELLEEDSELCCPVSLVLFVDPVIASDGFMYEKASLDGLLRCKMASPMTRERLKKEYLPAQKRSYRISADSRKSPDTLRSGSCR